MKSLKFVFMSFRGKQFHDGAQCLFGQVEGYVSALCIGQDESLLDSVDVEDTEQVDDELSSKSHEESVLSQYAVYGLGDFCHSEGQHEMKSRLVVDMRVVVICLHV